VTPVPLLGRDAPLAELRAALDQAADRRGQLVLLSGEPGIGKSALADVVGREAAARGAEVVLGRAWELAEAPPYFPVWPCLRALGIAPPRGASVEADAFHLWERVLEALGRASSARPVVWILEDLHAADHLTLDLLTFLGRPLRALSVLLLGTRRDRDPHLGERTAARLARLARDGREIHLERLGARDLHALAQSVAGGALPPGVERGLADRSGGNPLFVIECARAYRQGAPAQVPATVRELTAERVALLPEGTRETLACGAVVGREFTAAVVARMLEGLPAQVIERLTPALRAGVVDELRPAHYRFSHILVRDAVEEGLPAERRGELHDRAERALSGDSVDVLCERARHALGALRPDAAGLAVSAARTLESMGAHDRALAVYQRLEEAEAAGLTGARAGGEEALHRAAVARAAGRYQEAGQRCQAVMSEARSTRDPALLARAALELGAELRPAMVDRNLVEALREALAALGATDPLAIRVKARLAAALQPASDPNAPMAVAREALAQARALGDPATLLEVLYWAGSAMVDYAPVPERLAVSEELRARAMAQGDPFRALSACARLALDHAEIGDLDAFEAEVDRMRLLSVELAHPRRRWRALFFESMRATARGDFDHSDRCLVEVQQHASVTDDPALNLSLMAHVSGRAVLFHRDDEVRRALVGIEGVMTDMPEADLVASCLRAGAMARQEDSEAVARELTRLGGRLPLEASDLRFMYCEAVALCGSQAQREALHALMLPMADRHQVAGHVEMHYEGPIQRALAMLELGLGRAESAVARLTAVLPRARARGYRLWVAQMSYDVGRALAAAGRPAEASAAFREALAEAEALAMPGLVARTRARLQVPVPAPILPEALTMVREGDVWRVERGARSVRVRHSRGLELLARLVERTGEEMHVLALASDSGSSLVEADAGEALDAEARRAYKARLEELEGEIDEAQEAHDAGRHQRLLAEREAIAHEVGRATGLRGRSRPTASASERARVNVQRRLKDAVARIAELDGELGDFFSHSLHTGTYCSFRP
jgi:tetratricopeptide (TPR) repeat protein